MQKRAILFLTILITFFSLSNPAFSYKKVKCFVLVPPKKVLSGVKRIAILDFKTESSAESEKKINSTEKLLYQIFTDLKDYKTEKSGTDYGKQFSDMLISALMENRRGIKKIKTGFLGMGSGKEGKTLQDGTFTNVFEVLERNQLMKIIEEKKLSASGLVADDQMVELGGMLGVQALVIGNVNYSFKDTDYQQTRTKKKNGKKVSYKVNCQKRKVNINIRARIINAETGEILGSTKASRSIEKNHCDGDWGTLPSVDELVTQGLKDLLPKIADYFTPHYELRSLELEKIGTKKYKKQAEKAAKLAEDLKIDEAYFIYDAIYQDDPYNPKVLYNLGIMHEIVGNFDEALQYYQMAQQLKDEGRYRKAVKRMEKSIAFKNALAQMGIEIRKHEFVLSEEKKLQSIAKRVEIKGDRDKRYPIFQQPDSASEVIAKVPGGVTFPIIRKVKDWYLIQLLGNKQGYVHQSKVKLKD